MRKYLEEYIFVIILLLYVCPVEGQKEITKDSLAAIKNVQLQNVVVKAKKSSVIKTHGAENGQIITGTELLRAACCNLGESFISNPSVDVSYSDAATGAKQIKLLGLSGKYVQMLSENIPNYRGASAPFALGYIPGPWMQSIQVSTGASSVKNGYESITGQINVEFKKPQAPKYLEANIYYNSMNKIEANFDANIHLNKHLSTAFLGHYENQISSHDKNNDGFIDVPCVEQYDFQNRWAWMGTHYVFQGSFKATKENRTSGQDEMYAMNNSNKELYKIGIKTERYEAFTKNAFMFNKEHGSNVALILSGSFHNQDSYYGHKYYDVDEKNAYTSLMYESEYGKRHKLSTGISLNYDRFDQWELLNENLLSTDRQKVIESETTPGIYAQYTYNLNDKVIIMAGLRADHSSVFGYFVTPRTHIKIAPSDNFNIRLSAGEGYRTNHVMAENNFLLASGRTIIIDQNLKQDKAWNFGISTTNYIYILNKRMTLNCEYYYTNFVNQVITDVDSDPHSVHFTNLEGSSYSHTFQADVTYPFFRGFTITAAYRLTDVKCTYGGVLLEKPLTSKYKELLTASYSTPLGLMQFDVTLQINGGGRMPSPYTLRDGSLSWNKEYKSFEQLSAQITRFFRFGSIYIGGENLTNFKQKNPIINANDPWSKGFDSTMVWGPLEGSMFYIGLRLNINKI